jgi:FixJ family two-component response regulator
VFRAEASVISIVDDDVAIRVATCGLVRSLGYDATTFASAEAFLASDCVDTTECLITDLQMPGMDGAELQQRLLAEGRNIPIIFITGYPEESIRQTALKAGALGFLDKPFREDALIKCLDKALKGRADEVV